jgi:two-component system phosphate regulon sensor histidine kinase PhoR
MLPVVSSWRPALPFIVLLPLILAAAGVLSYFTWDTATRFEELGESSIAHSTLLLVEEKIDRIEQQIISQDNAVFHLVDVADPEALRTRWIPLAERISPSVRAIIVLTANLEVIDYAARATEDQSRVFMRKFKRFLAPELSIGDLDVEQLRHLHVDHEGTSYLLSYKTFVYDGQVYVVVAHHDVGYIVREEFPRLFANEDARAHFNVVDDDNKRIFGESLAKVAADYLVGMRFPTTLYRFRLQVAPKDAPLLEKQAKAREFNKAALIVSSVLVLLVGIAFFIYATIKERKLNALKSDFIANVSHELKTPLSVVRMFGEMLLTERVSSPEKRQKYLEMICRESERLSALIENVLDFAALERGKQKYEPVAADLAEIVQRAVETLRHRLENIEVRVHVPPEMPQVLADEQAVLLAVINLLDNAVKYGEGTPIDVMVKVERREATVSVRDRGPGIPLDQQRRVFDRFHRVRRPGQTIRGSGIGLSLVKHIAEAHGGRAWADNAEDGGAIVSFAIPKGSRKARESMSRRALNDAQQGVSS